MSTTLTSINLNRLVVFVAVIEAGSLTSAAARLGLAKTAVSTHIQKLESEVSASLLVRTTRSLHLTEAGESFYEAARQIVKDTETAVLAAGQNTLALRGTLRITAPVDYGGYVVAPVLVEMRKRYPALKIELLTGDRLFDLVGEGIDVAIRVGKLANSNLQAVRITTFEEWLVCRPDIVGDRMPKKPSDVSRLPFVALSVLPHPVTWKFEGPKKIQQTVHFEASITANTGHVMRSAVMAGGGLAVLPDIIVADDVASGRLVRLLPKWKLPGGGVYAVFPATRYRPQKVQALINALSSHVQGLAKR